MTTRPMSHLFTLRVWAEAGPEGQIEWRGRLQHVLSGEVRYFRTWAALIAQIEELLHAAGGPACDPQVGSEQ